MNYTEKKTRRAVGRTAYLMYATEEKAEKNFLGVVEGGKAYPAVTGGGFIAKKALPVRGNRRTLFNALVEHHTKTVHGRKRLA